MSEWIKLASQVIERCACLAECTEEPGHTTRTFLSPPMHEVHARIRRWMEECGLQVRVDAAGNIRGRREGTQLSGTLYIGSHLDTVPQAGMFDGILGVLAGIALMESSGPYTFPVEIVGFSEEEGVRFGLPFLGSRALIGDFTPDLLAIKDREGVSVEQAITAFGLDPKCIPAARAESAALGYLELHIEQGPVLESRNESVAVVDAIVGQSRLTLSFEGRANHAGTTPMHLRHDALAGAAEWVQTIERIANQTPGNETPGNEKQGLVATVGRLQVTPGATNVIASHVQASLDVRHPTDFTRKAAVEEMVTAARQIAERRALSILVEPHLDQASVAMDRGLTNLLEQSVAACGFAACGFAASRLNSGAGHDAMVIAPKIPAAMLFLRSPGGISHHPDESVRVEDVAAALQVGHNFLERLGGIQ